MLVTRRAILFDGGLNGEEKEFLLGLCVGDEQFDIMRNVRGETHEGLRIERRVQSTRNNPSA